MLQLTARDAARLVVHRQGLAARSRSGSLREVVAAIDALGCVQVDSISVVDKAQRLTLAARVGKLPPDLHNRLLRGHVFEYWSHELSLIPVADHRFFRARMRQRYKPWYTHHLADHPDLAEAILARVRDEGPLSARDFGGAGQGYWEWTPAKRVFDALWTSGQLAISHRQGFERRYDLVERVLPAAALAAPEPTSAERLEHFVRRTVRARGLVTVGRLSDYYRTAGASRRIAPVAAALVERGELLAAELDGRPAVVDPAAPTLLELPPPRTPVLLCPFDNLIWDREETRRIFGFSHALEIYKRRADRVYGYYVLPLLAGDRIVGRVDVKTERERGVLVARAVHWERRPAWSALERAMRRLAFTLGLEGIEVPSGAPAPESG